MPRNTRPFSWKGSLSKRVKCTEYMELLGVRVLVAEIVCLVSWLFPVDRPVSVWRHHYDESKRDAVDASCPPPSAAGTAYFHFSVSLTFCFTHIVFAFLVPDGAALPAGNRCDSTFCPWRASIFRGEPLVWLSGRDNSLGRVQRAWGG